MKVNPKDDLQRFQLGEFWVDAGNNTISCADTQRHIEPKAMEVLTVLVRHAGETVERAELLQQVWGNRVVVEEALTRIISQLRIALHDNKSKSLIQTIPKKGYRLTGDVTTLHIPAPSEGQPDEPASTPTPGAKHLYLVVAVILLLCVVAGFLVWRNHSVVSDTPHAYSLSVLPLNILSTNSDAQYLAEGIPEELMTALSKNKLLHVTSRSSAFAYASQYDNVQQIAAALDVRYVVEGSLRQQGERITVTARLIDAQEDKTLWSERYTSSQRNLYDITQKIVHGVVSTLLPQETTPRVANKQTSPVDVEAYHAYLQGRYFLMNGKTSEWFRRAEQAFLHAIALDPDYADAYGSLAYIYARYNYHDTYMAADIAKRKASDAIAKAPGNLNAQLAAAIVATSEQHFDKARTLLDGILENAPNNATALYLYSELALAQNHFDDALHYATLAHHIEPLSPWVNVNLAIVHYWRGDYNQATNAAREAIRIDKEYTWAFVWLAKTQLKQGLIEQAIQTMQTCLSVDDSSPVNTVFTGILFLENNDIASARPYFTQAAKLFGDQADAGFWKSFIRFAYQQESPEVGIPLMENLALLNNRIVNLVPILVQLYRISGQYQRGIEFLSTLYETSPSTDVVENYLNYYAIDGEKVLQYLAGEQAPTPDQQPSTLYVYQTMQAPGRQVTRDQYASLPGGWPMYMWLVKDK